MDINYRQALTEVLEVLNHTEKDLIERMPPDFAIFLLRNQDKEYMPNLDFTSENWETSLKEEAQAILAYIYSEYMTTEQEKLNILEDNELVQKGEAMLKKYGAEDLFNNAKEVPNNKSEENLPLQLDKKTWYKKLLKKLLNLFK